MEERRYAERDDPCPTPEEKRHNEKIKQQRAITHRVNGPFLREKSSDNREIEMVSHHPAHGFAAKPVGIELGNSSIKINHRHLSAQQPKRPRWRTFRVRFSSDYCVHRECVMCGNEN